MLGALGEVSRFRAAASTVVLCLGLWLWGSCASNHGTCEQYIHCAGVTVGPDYAEDLSVLYARGGSCWKAASNATCGQECEEGLLGLWYVTEDPACEPDQIDDDVLTEERFNAEFIDRFCLEWESCNGDECPALGSTSTGTSQCDFDPAAGQACLQGEWLCNRDFPGFEFPIPPVECSDVCGLASTTTTTTTSGT